MARLRKVFPGGNTALGFHSFYDHIIEPDATRIFVVKGGPGVGKSTFMRKIGEEMLARGFDVEFHCCSSDNGSLDGVVFPAIGVALIDGTAPHVVDPRHPGAVDEIIHLGDHWNEAGLRAHKREIIACNREIARLFRRAYSYLAAARLFLEEVRSFYRETGAFNQGAFDRLVLELTHEIFTGRPRQTDRPRVRRLFATAITPDGPVSHLESIVGPLGRRVVINGDDGTGKTTLVRRLMEAALMRGFDVEAFHCALDPVRVEHLVVPALDLAVVNAVEPHFYQPKEGDRVVDTMTCVEPVVHEAYLAERITARQMYRQCFNEAVTFIRRAKQVHDEMEGYYTPNMNFDEIERRRQKVLARILEMAAAQCPAGR
jgi:GTPase SAR1 family protein